VKLSLAIDPATATAMFALAEEVELGKKNAKHHRNVAKAAKSNAEKAARQAAHASEREATAQLRREQQRKAFEQTAKALHIPLS